MHFQNSHLKIHIQHNILENFFLKLRNIEMGCSLISFNILSIFIKKNTWFAYKTVLRSRNCTKFDNSFFVQVIIVIFSKLYLKEEKAYPL